jgi:hypothetical protein
MPFRLLLLFLTLACVAPRQPSWPQQQAALSTAQPRENSCGLGEESDHSRIRMHCEGQGFEPLWCTCIADKVSTACYPHERAQKTCDEDFHRVLPKSEIEVALESAAPATVPIQAPAEYLRKSWRHWTDEDGDCQDTRQEVLIAESRVEVTFKTGKKCKVAEGLWICPYTNVGIADPSELAIDHLVPFAAAHRAGAHRWSAAQKREFANSLEDPAHLVAVSVFAKRSKEASGPKHWLPKNNPCSYVKAWLRVKARWSLSVTKEEKEAIRSACEHERVTAHKRPLNQRAPVRIRRSLPASRPGSNPYRPKNCHKGKPCGNTCIARSRKCHL